MTAIGSRNNALITATGSQIRRSLVKRASTARGPCRQASSATAQAISSGTKNRKQACPWMSSQPDSATIQTSRTAPAATLATASTKTRYGTTYMYGIQSEFSMPGCQTAAAATSATGTRTPAGDRVQPYPIRTASAAKPQFSANTASMCAFHAVGTACSRSRSRNSPAACTYI
ncbi:MAG TPA: hypothetical protein VFB06_31610 [Streptosporangiaceae bacterium]|nr:hypothetical protein [Streptosporangiaceae bacterium]